MLSFYLILSFMKQFINIVTDAARWISSLLCVTAVVFSSAANAQLAGHNVIFIHGAFWQEDLIDKPSYEEIQFEHDEAGNIIINAHTGLPIARDRGLSEALDEIVDARLNWGGQHQIEDNGGQIAIDIFRRAMEYQTQQQICVDACILLTFSAGDLIARHFLENQQAWFEARGVPPFNVIATIDLAGAGGGTEAANWAMAWAQGIPVADWIADAMLSLIGFDHFSENAGIIEDLTTNAARNIATDYHGLGIPRLRISVSGTAPGNLAGKGLGPLIVGADDSLIPAHSSCGVQRPAAIESCSSTVGYDGKLGRHDGPGAQVLWWRRPALLPNHFPIIQSNAYGHHNLTGEHRGPATSVDPTHALEDITIELDSNEMAVNRPWWQWWRKQGRWRFIDGTEKEKSIADVIIDTFDTEN